MVILDEHNSIEDFRKYIGKEVHGLNYGETPTDYAPNPMIVESVKIVNGCIRVYTSAADSDRYWLVGGGERILAPDLPEILSEKVKSLKHKLADAEAELAEAEAEAEAEAALVRAWIPEGFSVAGSTRPPRAPRIENARGLAIQWNDDDHCRVFVGDRGSCLGLTLPEIAALNAWVAHNAPAPDQT